MLHSFLFAAAVVGFDACRFGTPGQWLAMQISISVAFILAPVLVDANGSASFRENDLGERAQVLGMLQWTDVLIVLMIAAQIGEKMHIGSHLPIAVELIFVFLLVLHLVVIFVNRPKVNQPDRSSATARISAAKLLVPIALGSYYYFSDTGSEAYALIAVGSLLIAYLIAHVLVWNRNAAQTAMA